MDIASTAVERAQAMSQEIPGADFVLADFLDLPPAHHGGFDYVYENTCFCAIPLESRETYVSMVDKALKPGGLLLGLFYPQTSNPPGEGPPFSIEPENLRDLFSKQFVEKQSWIPSTGFHGRVGNELFMIWQKLKNEPLK